ncbi:Cullin, partial [Lentinula raphanica]
NLVTKHGLDVSVEETWSTLSQNIKEILNHNASNLSFEENHRYAYHLVLSNNGELLYRGMKRIVADNLQKLAKEQIITAFPTTSIADPTQRSQENELLMKALRNVWDDHTSNMTKLGQLLKYMIMCVKDRRYTKNAGVPETWEAGLQLFLDHIICPPIKDRLMTAILNQIQYEREGYTINRSAVKGCVDVLRSLDSEDNTRTVYQQDLEPVLLRESEAFYKNYGDTILETSDTSEYLLKVESRLESEESRTHHYLSRTTTEPLLRILQQHLLTAHLDAVIAMPNSGLDTLIDLDKFEDLGRLYRLFHMVSEGIPCLKKAFKASIARRGSAINQTSSGLDAGSASDVKDNGTGARRTQDERRDRAMAASQTLNMALKWVQDVLDLKDKMDAVWKKSFDSNSKIEAVMIEAFETFINSNTKCSEFISLFIDDHLKRGLKGASLKTDAEVDAVLEKTITVFRYLTEKDVFERYYKNHLAKRLLHARSVSDDAERGMLARLKIECGTQFTQKLEGMFHDIKLSADTLQSYKEHLLKSSMSPQIDLSVIIMTSTFWPMSHSSSPCNLPQQLLETLKPFERFYLSRHSGRRLTWQLSLGNVDIRTSFKNRTHDVNVATYAAVILLLFEDLKDDDFLTYEEIHQATALEHTDLQRQLQSLACAKYKILKKHPPGRDVQTTDSFSFNSAFTAPLQKIKISTVSSKVESGEELKETRDRIDEERRHQTEASIVRIMKDRKHMSHNELINEVTRLLAGRFQPNPLVIKKRIEGLIEREYLERGEDHKSYNYLVSSFQKRNAPLLRLLAILQA